MFGLGIWEVALFGLIILLLFGSRLPNLMRSMGSSLLEFKKGMKEGEDEVNPPPTNE